MYGGQCCLTSWLMTWVIGQICTLSKLAGYTKLGGDVDTPDDGAVIQVNLSRLVKRAVISKGKCQVLHLRRSSLWHMRGQAGWKTARQWSGPWGLDRWEADSQHCTLGARKANRILGCVRKTAASKPRVVMLPLYRAAVLCPVLGLPIQERYRLPGASLARTVKMIKGLEHTCCEESLRKPGLFSLGNRRLGGDLINLYKYLYGREYSWGSQSSQWHPVIQVAMGTRKHLPLYMWSNIGIGCLEGLWSLALLTLKTWLGTSLSNLLQITLLEQWLGLDTLKSSLPT